MSFLPRVRAPAAVGPSFSCLERDRVSRQLLQPLACCWLAPSRNSGFLGCPKFRVLVRRGLKTSQVWTNSSLWGILDVGS